MPTLQDLFGRTAADESTEADVKRQTVIPENGTDTADTECVGPVEQYLTVDVPAFAIRHYNTATRPEQWAIGGLSEGGMCGLMLGVRHPERFRTFLDFGGLLGLRSGDDNSIGSTVSDLFRDNQADFDAHEPLAILQKGTFPELGGWFEVGSDDPAPLQAQRELVPAAQAAKVAMGSVIVPGGEHTFPVWKQAFQDALPWTAARLGIGRPVAKCPHQ